MPNDFDIYRRIKGEFNEDAKTGKVGVNNLLDWVDDYLNDREKASTNGEPHIPDEKESSFSRR